MDGKPTQWSHMLGVADDYRNAGLGRRLKLAQRLRALDLGCDLMEWTFDPLQAINAHLNFARLGVDHTAIRMKLHWVTSPDASQPVSQPPVVASA